MNTPSQKVSYQTQADLISIADSASSVSLVNSPELAKVGDIPLFLNRKSFKLMVSDHLLPSFGGILTGIRGNLPSMDKIPVTYPSGLLTLVSIGRLALMTTVLYVSWCKRLPFCPFWGNNFIGKSYRRKWQFGGSHLHQLTYRIHSKSYSSGGLISVT